MAIGDHLNDIEMLRWAGIGVAMGDAMPEVCAAADCVTSSYREDGVARAVERFVLHPYSSTVLSAHENVGGERP